MRKASLCKDTHYSVFGRSVRILTLSVLLALFAMPSMAGSNKVLIQSKTASTSLNDVLKKIESESDFVFFFSDNVKPVLSQTVVAKEGAYTVEQMLDNVLVSTNLVYEIKDKQISLLVHETQAKSKTVAVLEEQQQVRHLEGKIVDIAGEPIIGASVAVPKTTKGTMSDHDGAFVLREVDLPTTITISYLGFISQTIDVKNYSTLNIVLHENLNEMDEVVIIGYGTQKKVNLTGAVSSIDMKDLKDRPVASAGQMLQGVVPGLTVTSSTGRPGGGASTAFNIRGVSSINKSSPLVLIDGIEGDINALNPNDIANISVLKDASSAAVYGAKATFGVILVTTKAGESGKTKVSYSGQFGWGKPTTSTDYETRGYYSVYLNDLFSKSYSGSNYTRYTSEDYDELWARRNDKTEHPDRPWVTIADRGGRDTYMYYGNTDWYHHLYKDTRPTTNHNVSLSGGNDKVKYYVSGAFHQDEGIYRQDTDKFRKVDFRSKVDFMINKWMTFSANTSYMANSYTFPGAGNVNTAFTLDKVHGLASIVPINPDGTSVYQTSIMDYAVMDGLPVILDQGLHTNKDKSDKTTTMVEWAYKPIKGLELKANFNYAFTNIRASNRQVNGEYSKFPGISEVLDKGRFEDKLSETVKTHNYYALNMYGNYSKTIAKNHNVKVLAGYNWEKKTLKDITATGFYLMSETLGDLDVVGTDADGNKRSDVSGGYNDYATLGVFTRVNYDYKGKYLFEFGGRYDGSSRFARDHRWAFYPSGSAGWRMSEEPFYAPIKQAVEDIKFRASYGILGNQQVGYYDYIRTVSLSKMNYLFGGDKAVSSKLSAPTQGDLTWEKAEHLNIGIDLSTLNSRLNLTADYYIRNTKDMLTQGLALPSVYGATDPKFNSADLSTRGYEFSLSWRDQLTVLGKPFSYNITGTFNDYTTEVTKFDNPDKLFVKKYYKGMKWGEIWGYRIDGYFQSEEQIANHKINQTWVNEIINSSAGSENGLKPGDMIFKDLDGNDKIEPGSGVNNSGDKEVIGNSEPRYIYGLSAGASWFGVDFNIFFQGVGRQDWYPEPNNLAFWGPYARPYSTYMPKNFHKQIWSEDNPNAYFPRPRGYTALQGERRQLTAVNDKYLQNIGYCRLKNVTVGYTLPTNLSKKLMLERLRVYFSGENLATWTSLKSDYIDPEQAGAGNLARNYPWQKTYTVGIDITF